MVGLIKGDSYPYKKELLVTFLLCIKETGFYTHTYTPPHKGFLVSLLFFNRLYIEAAYLYQLYVLNNNKVSRNSLWGWGGGGEIDNIQL